MIESENLIISNDINVKMPETLNRRRRLRFKCAWKQIYLERFCKLSARHTGTCRERFYIKLIYLAGITGNVKRLLKLTFV